jgi:hypothetical protein
MKWPWLAPRRGDVVAIVLCAFFAGVLLFVVLTPQLNRPTNGGFGPEWICAPVVYGGPICIKRLPWLPK